MTGPRILHLDIETAPIESYHWGLWQQNIGLNQILVEWTVLSFCAWWEGDPKSKIMYHDVSQQDDLRDDSGLLALLWELLDEADFVVAQNGQRFDLKKIRARMILNGYPPFSPVRVIDTLLIAKGVFGFTSNKLEWMSTYLSKIPKRKHGKFPGFDLWVACMARDPEAWAEMKLYNIDDVQSLREVWLELRPWAIDHPNVAQHLDDDELRCPKCASTDVQKRGYQRTNAGQYHRYVCNACGGWSRSRYTINSKAKRLNTLT